MFNIETVISDMINAIKGKLINDWANIKSTVENFTNDSKENLAKLANQRINNQIDDEELADQLADEKDIWEADFDTLKIIAKSDAEQAINAAIDVFNTAITTAIGVL